MYLYIDLLECCFDIKYSMLIKVQVFRLSLKNDVNIYSIIKLLYCCRVNCFYYVIYVDNVQIKGYLY